MEKPEYSYKGQSAARAALEPALKWFRAEAQRIWEEAGHSGDVTEFANIKAAVNWRRVHDTNIRFEVRPSDSFRSAKHFALRKDGTLNERSILQQLGAVKESNDTQNARRQNRDQNKAIMEAAGITTPPGTSVTPSYSKVGVCHIRARVPGVSVEATVLVSDVKQAMASIEHITQLAQRAQA